MSELNSILNIRDNFFEVFPSRARLIDNTQIERVINKNIRILDEITSRNFPDSGVQVSQQSVDEVISKVVEQAEIKNIEIALWTIKEMRILSYNISRLEDEKDLYEYAFKLLDEGWRNMYFNGIIFSLMNSWIILNPEFKRDLYTFLKNKLLQYSGGNKRYITLKNHLNFFDNNGPQIMSKLLLSRNQDIYEAPHILGFNNSTLFQSYYSDVIIQFYEQNPVSLEQLEKVLTVHKHARTKKLLLAHLVEIADRKRDESFQTTLSKFINRVLGDVTLVATWAPFPGATYEEAQQLKHAMELVILWFKRRIIESFFEVCVQDYARKFFWRDYVQYIDDFKIVGSSLTKYLLDNDSRINTMYMSHFVETNSRYSQTSALVLSMGNKILIEFSDTGALYVYNKGDQRANCIKKGVKYIDSTNDLKSPYMNMLIDLEDRGYLGFREEGKMHHRGRWEDRLRRWIDRMLMPYINSIPESNSEYDDVFIETPLPKAKPIKIASKNNIEQSNNNNKEDNYNESTVSEGDVLKSMTIHTAASKWIYHDMCRIVMNDFGYYLEIKSHPHLHLLRYVEQNVKPPHNLWIKKPNQDGWNIISHASRDGENLVGYLKINGNKIIYKNNMLMGQDKIFNIKNGRN